MNDESNERVMSVIYVVLIQKSL
ncbi:hypothetical protein D039_1239A, partial [Vibrio parahaemolyticus EKP-028]